MAATHGKGGIVKLGTADTVLSIKNWKLDRERDEHDTTSFASAGLPNRTFIMGLVGASGSFEGDLDMADTTGHVALINSLTSDTALTFKLYINATQFWSFSGFITGVSGEVPIDDLETVSYDFRVTGAVTFT